VAVNGIDDTCWVLPVWDVVVRVKYCYCSSCSCCRCCLESWFLSVWGLIVVVKYCYCSSCSSCIVVVVVVVVQSLIVVSGSWFVGFSWSTTSVEKPTSVCCVSLFCLSINQSQESPADARVTRDSSACIPPSWIFEIQKLHH